MIKLAVYWKLNVKESIAQKMRFPTLLTLPQAALFCAKLNAELRGTVYFIRESDFLGNSDETL